MLTKSIFFNRYEKTIKCSVSYFLKHNLDAFYLATNAPGRSTFNRVERRMAPLSHDLAGVVLPHDTFGSHNNKNETVDKELEMKNFAKAGEVLAEIWSKTVIDNYPAVAEYINPSDEVFITAKDQEWMAKHVRESAATLPAAVQEEVPFFFSYLMGSYHLLYLLHKAEIALNMEKLKKQVNFFLYLQISRLVRAYCHHAPSPSIPKGFRTTLPARNCRMSFPNAFVQNVDATLPQ